MPSLLKKSPWARLLPPRLHVGVALGGGAARALAHVGVLKVLAQAEIPIHVVTGCSLGAITGGCYASSLDALEVERKVLDYLESEAFQRKVLDLFRVPRDQVNRFSLMRFLKQGIYYGRILFHPSFFTMEEFERAIAGVVPDTRIEDLKIPFACNAAHLYTGRERVFEAGPLRPALMASSAIPGIFPPVVIGKEAYIDGGWVDPIPVRLARQLGADFVIAVDVSYHVRANVEYRSGFSVVSRGLEIKTHRLIELSRLFADVVIRVEMDDIAWVDFVRVREIIARGEAAARQALAGMLKKIRRRKRKIRIPFREELLRLLK